MNLLTDQCDGVEDPNDMGLMCFVADVSRYTHEMLENHYLEFARKAVPWKPGGERLARFAMIVYMLLMTWWPIE